MWCFLFWRLTPQLQSKSLRFIAWKHPWQKKQSKPLKLCVLYMTCEHRWYIGYEYITIIIIIVIIVIIIIIHNVYIYIHIMYKQSKHEHYWLVHPRWQMNKLPRRKRGQDTWDLIFDEQLKQVLCQLNLLPQWWWSGGVGVLLGGVSNVLCRLMFFKVLFELAVNQSRIYKSATYLTSCILR